VSKGVSTTERGQRASAGDPRPEPAGNCLEGGEWWIAGDARPWHPEQ
jgi:hypothetical protein